MDKTACVVGAAGGIGAATARRLEHAGFTKVLRMDLDGPLPIDLSDVSSVETAFAAARQQAPRLHALVIASGILDLEKLDAISLERWNRVLAVNLTGPFLCCKYAREWLVDGGRMELAPRRITVNCVAPGAVQTSMRPSPSSRATRPASSPAPCSQ